MVRSMYSGVSGMRAHQTRMDVIGNNIANVNTYGFKSSRATFRDTFYQNVRNASAGSDARGGVNPSSVGYGSTVSSVDVIMGTATMTSTGNPLDVAISGEGFFQVMDNDGNIFYTKAGMLDIDAYGNLIDTNGYFVLGTSGNPRGKSPSSDKIQFQIPAVQQALSKGSSTVNGTELAVTASKYTGEGNVNFSFSLDSTLPYGQDVKALIGSSGTISIKVRPDASFTGLSDFSAAVNTAITEANNNTQHAAGEFTFTTNNEAKFGTAADPVTGAQLIGTNYGVTLGSVTIPAAAADAISFVSVGGQFRPDDGATSLEVTVNAGPPETIDITVTVGTAPNTTTYTSNLADESQFQSTKQVVLKRAGAGLDDSITISVANWERLANAAGTHAGTVDAVASEDSKDVGLGNAQLKLTGGTAGGEQSIKDLTGISIGGDGTIVASHGVLGELVIGRIDLATFDNARGLQRTGSSYFAQTVNSGEAAYAVPGENGTGALIGSSLELSNVDLSQEFSDMITTQRGFQANSRLITVSDTMLEELINLKR